MSEQREERITVIVLLPEYYNPDEYGRRGKVEEYKFRVTGKEITQMMMQRYGKGGGSFIPEPEKGYWGEKGVIYEDDMMALQIDNFPNTGEDKHWLRQYAQDVLCARFRQKVIYIKFVPLIEVYEVYIARKRR